MILSSASKGLSNHISSPKYFCFSSKFLNTCRGQDAVLPLPAIGQAPLQAGQNYQVNVLPDMVTLAVSMGFAVIFCVCFFVNLAAFRRKLLFTIKKIPFLIAFVWVSCLP